MKYKTNPFGHCNFKYILKFAFLVLLIHMGSGIFNKAMAFGCSGTYTYNVSAFTVTRTSGVTVPLPASFLYCSGSSPQQDALRIQSVTLNPKLIAAGFTDSVLGVQSVDYKYPFTTALNICVWYNSACSPVNASGNTSTFTPVLIRSGAGGDLTMTSGETLLTIVLYQRSNGTWGWPQTITYKLNGNINPPNYTCSVNNYDSSVRMPVMSTSDIRNGSTGKIVSSKKSFNFQLSCIPGTIVSLTYDGTKLSGTGTDDVLINQTTGNDNMGIQLFNGSTALKIGQQFAVSNSADAAQLLSYDAYSYYKGGNVTAGLLKSSVTFTFNYQ